MKPYSEQLEAVAAAVKSGQGIISMPTGTGKSVTMALLVYTLQVRTLIVVPNLTLKMQLTASFKQWFGSLENIVIENIDSNSLNDHTDFDCLIIDEAHHSAASTYRRLNKKAWKGIFYRFFFTATPFRSRDEEHLLMESITGQVIYRLDYKRAVEAGMIVPVEAYYYTLPTSPVEGYTWAEVYSELVVNNDKRNSLIREILFNLVVQGQKAICLVKEIAHGKKLESEYVAFANGQDGMSAQIIGKFCDGTLPVIVGTTGVLGEGVDSRPAEWVIIAGLGKSKPAFLQQVGRGVRRYGDKTSAKIILFKDPSHKYTLRHFKAQCKHLRDEYGVIPVKLECDYEVLNRR